jgi:hypothetical protein
MMRLKAFLLRTQIGAITVALLCAYTIQNFVGVLIAPFFYSSLFDLYHAYQAEYLFKSATTGEKLLLLSLVRSVVHLGVTFVVTYLLARWLFAGDIRARLTAWRTPMFPEEVTAPASEQK